LKNRERGISAAAVLILAIISVPGAWADSPAVQSAQRQFNAGNYAGAISTLQTAASQDPSNANVFYWLGRSYYETSNWDQAVANAEKSVQLDPKNSLYHDWLGRAYGGKADRDHSFSDAKKVKSEFQQAVQLDPSNIQARKDLEEYCVDAPWIAGGSKDEALEQVNAIAAADPVEGYDARATYLLEGMKKPDEAAAEMRKVLAAKPKNIELYFDAAAFFRGEDKPDDLKAAIDGAAQVSPNDPRLAYYRGVQAVLSNSNSAMAEQDLKSYLASTPDRSDWPSHASARDWLGRLYESQGKRMQAAEQYRAALQLDPKLKEARKRLEKLEKSQ
jgi:tetratricopeptide (TPR) repeat protein